MFYRRNDLACFGFVLLHLSMTHQLLAGSWMLPFGETGKFFWSYRALKPKLVDEPTLPFPLDGIALLPIVLHSGGKLFGVIALCLTGGQRFRDGQHGNSSTPKNEILWFQRFGI